MSYPITNDQFSLLAFQIRNSLNKYRDKLPLTDDLEVVVERIITDARVRNSWFISSHVEHALASFADDLDRLAAIELVQTTRVKEILVLLRSNAPFENLADIMGLIKAGFVCRVKPSPELTGYLTDIRDLLNTLPAFSDKIIVDNGISKHPEAIVCFAEVGSTITDYFSKYPFIELSGKGRSYIIKGDETNEELEQIALHICMHFGRSQYNIKVLYVPEGYDMETLKPFLAKYSEQLFHHKYFNNYDYRKSVLIINRIPFMEASPLLITQMESQAGYTGILAIQYYKDKSSIADHSLLKNYPLIEQPFGIKSRIGREFESNVAPLSVFIERLNKTKDK